MLLKSAVSADFSMNDSSEHNEKLLGEDSCYRKELSSFIQKYLLGAVGPLRLSGCGDFQRQRVVRCYANEESKAGPCPLGQPISSAREQFLLP